MAPRHEVRAPEKWLTLASSHRASFGVVHSLFADTDDWDDQLEGTESGWPGFFAILRLYLTHFPGQPCSMVRVMGPAVGSESEVWESLSASLGIAGKTQGQRWSTPENHVPAIAGTVERLRSDTHAAAILRIDEPSRRGPQPVCRHRRLG